MSPLASVILQDLLRASWQGGLFILAVYGLCRVFRRMPASIRHWLWWIACLQLPVRLLFLSPVALPILPNKTTLEPIAANADPTFTQNVGSQRLAPLANGDQRLAPLANGNQRLAPLANLDQRLAPLANGDQRLAPPASPIRTLHQVGEPEVRLETLFGWKSLLVFGWGVGVATVLVLAARRLIRTRKLLLESVPAPGAAEFLTADLSKLLHLTPPPIRESPAAPCPLLAGWWKPTIVLPAGFTESTKTTELQMAVAHELSHLKRRDLWLAAAPFVTHSLFYFHPLAWLAVRESAAASEEACDIEAMRLSGGSPSAYARLLLNSAKADVPIVAVGAALGFRLLQRRIRMLNQTIFPARPLVRRGYTALVALALVCSIPWTVTAQTPHKKAHKVAAKKAPELTTYYITTAGGQRVGTLKLQTSKVGNKRPTSIGIIYGATAPAAPVMIQARPGAPLRAPYPPSPRAIPGAAPMPAQPAPAAGVGSPSVVAVPGAAPTAGVVVGQSTTPRAGSAPSRGVGGAYPPAPPAGVIGSATPQPGTAPTPPAAPAGVISAPGLGTPARISVTPPYGALTVEPGPIIMYSRSSYGSPAVGAPGNPRLAEPGSQTTYLRMVPARVGAVGATPARIQSTTQPYNTIVSPPARSSLSYTINARGGQASGYRITNPTASSLRNRSRVPGVGHPEVEVFRKPPQIPGQPESRVISWRSDLFARRTLSDVMVRPIIRVSGDPQVTGRLESRSIRNGTMQDLLFDSQRGLLLAVQPNLNGSGDGIITLVFDSKASSVSISAHAVVTANGTAYLGVSEDGKTLYYKAASGWMAYTKAGAKRSLQPKIVISVSLETAKS